MKHWSQLTHAEVLEQLDVTSRGLSRTEAEQRLAHYGPNALPVAPSDSLFLVFVRQFQSPLITTLLLASVIIYLLGETTDALIILFVLVFNATVGTIQEGRAQQTLRALKDLAKTQTTVLRDDSEQIIADELLVPGDIVLLQEGQRIPADVRIISEQTIAIDESSLTGESVPVHKISRPLKAESVSIGDLANMAFKGTYVTSGSATAVVVQTGIQTEIGKIAQAIEHIDTDIPLRRAVERLIQQIMRIVLGVSLFLFIVGISTGHEIREMFVTVISLAVSAIPEGLPIVLTLVLATGVWRMSKQQALVKKLEAVEALGQTSIIAVDKTGTITRNELMVAEIFTPDGHYTVEGKGYAPEGRIRQADSVVKIGQLPDDLRWAARAALCNASAEVVKDAKRDDWQVTGDPTEAAMRVFALKTGLDEKAIGAKLKEEPFNYEKKYRVTLYQLKTVTTALLTGAPEKVLTLSRLTEAKRTAYMAEAERLSKQGYRVVGFAYKNGVTGVQAAELKDLVFGGFYAMRDVLHDDIAETVRSVTAAGITVVMITGDHPETAKAIAADAQIYHEGDRVMTGAEIEPLSPEDLARQLDRVTVFARVTPMHKQLIVQAYQHRGATIAMTGDGVNDTPSLVAADLGMAMGQTGTEIAKEAADIVLLDDNFKSIVSAIEEGRSIYRTVRKVIAYLFATSAGEILVIALSLLFGLPLPVTAAQIIWLNLVTDGFLDISLAMEPKEKGLLRERWNSESQQLVDRLTLFRIGLFACVMAAGTLFALAYYGGSSAREISTIALTTMAVFQWFNAWNSRHPSQSVFSLGLLTNPFLVAATLVIVALQLAALHVPQLQTILFTEPLSLGQWIGILIIASSALWIEEIRKFFARGR